MDGSGSTKEEVKKRKSHSAINPSPEKRKAFEAILRKHKEENVAGFRMIAQLSIDSKRWEVVARLVLKTMKKVSQQSGLLVTSFLDSTGEIKAIGWGAEGLKWFKKLEVGEVYKLAHLQIQATTAKFSRIIPGHIELKFLKDTACEIVKEIEKSKNIPPLQFSFTAINETGEHPVSSNIDIIGLVIDKSLSEHDRNEDYIVLVVETNNDRVFVKNFNIVIGQLSVLDDSIVEKETIVAMKGVKIIKNIMPYEVQVYDDSIFQVNPAIPEKEKIQMWVDCLQSESEDESSDVEDGDGNKKGKKLK